MSVLGLDHFNIRVSSEQMPAVKTFYEQVLGLKEGFRPRTAFNGHWLYAGEQAVLHLSMREAPQPHAPEDCLNHVALRCQDLPGFVDRLRRHGIDFSHGYMEELALTQLFFVDPQGVRIEINFVGERLKDR